MSQGWLVRCEVKSPPDFTGFGEVLCGQNAPTYKRQARRTPSARGLLFIAKGDYGIDAHGPASGHESGESSHSREHDRNGRECYRVAGGDTEQHVPEEA